MDITLKTSAFARLRKQSGLDIAAAAKEFHVSPDTIRVWESGQDTPPDQVIRILGVLADFAPSARAANDLDLDDAGSRLEPEPPPSGLDAERRKAERGQAMALSLATEPNLFEPCPVASAVINMAEAGVEARGAIFTRPEVVDFILDLLGYRSERPLWRMSILEPSFGGGDFLFAAIRRLIASYRATGRDSPAADLANAVRAVELHGASFTDTKERLTKLLLGLGVSQVDSESLTGCWLVQGDYLLTPLSERFDFVAGNPPYVRQELIPDALMAEYRRRYKTIYDRADIYIPFFERSLELLKPGGVLGFICADRWMKNRYGKPLRGLVGSRYHLRVFVDMVDTPAFASDVIAYPGIFVIANETGGNTRVAKQPEIKPEELAVLASALTGDSVDARVHDLALIRGDEPWIVDASGSLELVRELEETYPTLEEAGCRVGIGVATGADEAFIGPYDELDVEDDRKLPLVMTRDILTGQVDWRGLGVVNPFANAGGLVALEERPRMARYLEVRKDQIAGRHVAKKAPANWYRTIDRIYPDLVGQPKLLIPDIKGEALIVYDEGRYYPHHNLYFITSRDWDLRALQAVLLSGIAKLFVAAYSTKMRGGFLRFQAQYLRRIRVPSWGSVPDPMRQALVTVGTTRDMAAACKLVPQLYGLSAAEWRIVEGDNTGGASAI
jgi:hypothetical protein